MTWEEANKKAEEIIKGRIAKEKSYLDMITEKFTTSLLEDKPSVLKRYGIEIRKTTILLERLSSFTYKHRLQEKIINDSREEN